VVADFVTSTDPSNADRARSTSLMRADEEAEPGETAGLVEHAEPTD